MRSDVRRIRHIILGDNIEDDCLTRTHWCRCREAESESFHAVTTLIELKNPLYPGMEIVLQPSISVPSAVEVFATGESLTIAGAKLEDAVLVLTVFADSASAREQRFTFSELDAHKEFMQLVWEQVKSIRGETRFPYTDPSGPNSWMG